MKKQLFKKKKYYIQYTLLFCVAAVLVYGYFILYDKSFIYSVGGSADGITQHYPALCYYAKWMREIVRTLLSEHRLVIPEWSFSIGYGSDILTTLNYYVIGDPFSLFSVFVPIRYMQYYYGFMILLRLYCAGIAFSMYSSYMMRGKRCNAAILAGTFLYVFSMYGMQAGLKHPYFINAMIYFPLLLLGVEKLFKRERPFLFVITVCISASSNFYFFYMEVILTVLYVLLRLWGVYGFRQFRKACLEIARVGIYAVIGLCMSAVIFLPVMLAVFRDNRFSDGKALHLFYPLSYYTKFLSGFLTVKSPGYWCMMGFAAIGAVAVILLFLRKKQYTSLKTAFLFLTALLLFPVGSYILNACSYTASRWIWAYGFLIGYIVVVMWPHMQQITEHEKRGVFSVLFVWFLLCFILDNSRTVNLAFCLICGFAALCLLQMKEMERKRYGRNIKSVLLLTVLFVNIGVNAWYSFSIKNDDLLEEYESRTNVNKRIIENQDMALAQASQDDEDFFRCGSKASKINSSLLSGLHTTQYYWTLSNPAIADSNEQMGILVLTSNAYLDQDARAGLTSLANVRYYACGAGSGAAYAPYGFELEGTYEINGVKWNVYKNQYDLPFGYTYDKALDMEEFETLTSVQKEEAMLQGVLLEDAAAMQAADVVLEDVEVPFEIVCPDEKVSVQGQSIVTTSDKKNVTLNVEGIPGCETYLLIEGLNYQGCSPLDLYDDDSIFDPLNLYTEADWAKKGRMQQIKERYKNRNWSETSDLYITISGTDEDGSSVSRTLYHYTPEYTWYMGKENYTVNLGYSKTATNTISITFPEAGIYSYKDLKVVCKPMTGYAEQIAALGEEHLENAAFGTDRIAGEITVASDKLLCLSLPYTAGWTAYVDGEKTEILKANLMYSGLALEAGKHTIELRYRTPGLRIGMMISVLGALVLIYIEVKNNKRLNKTNRE